MKLPISHSFAATPAQVFAALTDPAVLQRCIDGCEKMEKTGEDSYIIHLKVGVAGMKGSYGGKVQITEKKPPESMTLALEGKGPPGFVKATAKWAAIMRTHGRTLSAPSSACTRTNHSIPTRSRCTMRNGRATYG